MVATATHRGVLGIRAAPNFSRFAPSSGRPNFSRFAPPRRSPHPHFSTFARARDSQKKVIDPDQSGTLADLLAPRSDDLFLGGVGRRSSTLAEILRIYS